MDHHHPHHRFWLIAAIAGSMVLALTQPGSLAQAQSVNDSYPNAAVSPIREDSSGSGAESLDGAETVAIPADAKAAADADNSSAYPASHNPDGASAPVLGPVAPDDESGSASKDDAVLEIPQLINPATPSTPNQSGNVQSAAGGGNDDNAAQANQAGGQTAPNEDDVAATADQVGTLQDYENQEGATPLAPGYFAPGIRIVQFPPLPALNALPRQPVGIPMAPSPIILPPTSSGPFPSTSPMLMAPRTHAMLMAPRIGTLGAFPRGGLIGFRR